MSGMGDRTMSDREVLDRTTGDRTMSDREVLEFLLASPPRPAVLSTVRPDGAPHAAPVWYDLDGTDLHTGTIVFNTGSATVKAGNIAHDHRVALTVQDDHPPFSYVSLTGVARLSDDHDEVRHWATRIGARYMGLDRAAEFGARNGVPGELLVRVRVMHVAATRDVAG